MPWPFVPKHSMQMPIQMQHQRMQHHQHIDEPSSLDAAAPDFTILPMPHQQLMHHQQYMSMHHHEQNMSHWPNIDMQHFQQNMLERKVLELTYANSELTLAVATAVAATAAATAPRHQHHDFATPAPPAPPPSPVRGIDIQSHTFRYDLLLEATNKFNKRLGVGGFGSVFEGVIASGTRVAVKRLEVDIELDPAGVQRSQMIKQMQTEVQILFTVQHPNIVQLLGSSTDGKEPCLVYALMEGGSLQDRLACSGVWKVALTAKERILVLSDVARGLAYLHTYHNIIHRDVKCANILLDRNCVGRLGDFGIAKSTTDAAGVMATHVQTGHVVGTHVYMSPEYKNGELSTKVDAYAFGLVVLEALTGYSILTPAPGYINLLCLFEEELDSADKLLAHLDKRASTSWDPHKAKRVPTLHSIAERCLEHRRKRRPNIVDVIPELEAVRQEIEALAPQCPETDNRECVVCFETGSNVEWMMLRPCGHVCVCRACCEGLHTCPLCRQAVSESFLAFF